MSNVEKKKLGVFIAIAYGVMLIMTVFMYISFKKAYDVTPFVQTLMMYPACGVIIGKLCFRDKEKPLPIAGYTVFLITTAALIIMSIVSAFIPLVEDGVSLWIVYVNRAVMIGSVVGYILFWLCGREKRKNSGLSRNNVILSIFFIVLFIVLFFVKYYLLAVYSIITKQADVSILSETTKAIFDLTLWKSLGGISLYLPLSIFMYLGEEYGWRYYFQPILQKKFGLRLGVIILGILWGVWHIAPDFMYYTKDSGVQQLCTQIIACIALAIFFGYAYMKTKNIWALAIMHFINNNFTAVMGGGGSDALQGNTIRWSMLPIIVLMYLPLFIFIFAPTYSKKKQAQQMTVQEVEGAV